VYHESVKGDNFLFIERNKKLPTNATLQTGNTTNPIAYRSSLLLLTYILLEGYCKIEAAP
jgi:hypothetical protein